MAWVVDTCVLLDIALSDAVFALLSAKAIDSARSDGLIACPITLVELSPEFGGNLAEISNFLSGLGVYAERIWRDADTDAAARAWAAYVGARRAGNTRKRPVADILIGAVASRHGGIITRNPNHFQPWFSKLKVLNPTELHS